MMFTFHISTLILMGIGCFVLGVIFTILTCSGGHYDGGIDGC